MASTSRENGFLPWKLRLWTTLLVIFVDIVFISIIICLLVISQSRSGFADVPSTLDQQLTLFGYHIGKVNTSWAYSLLWTSLPTLIVSIYVFGCSSIISDLQDRQPFIELAKPNGSRGKTSILLDYRQHFAPFRWFGAFRNKHHVLGVALLLVLVNQFILVSLASHLFVSGNVQNTEPQGMLITTAFNESAVNSKTNIASALNLVLATRNLDAQFPPWTVGPYAFPQFTSPKNVSSSTQIAADLTAYSANPDCLDIGNYSISVSSDGSGNAMKFSGTDRDCAFSQQLFVDGGGATEYIETSAVTNCADGNTRLILVSGYYDTHAQYSLSNINIISCIPSYWQTPGSLSISSQDSSIVEFIPANISTSFQWSSSETFEMGVHLASPLDPTATIQSTTFGLQVLLFTRKNNATLQPSSAELINATTEIFQSTFAFTAKLFILQGITNPETTTGSLITTVSRLFVVPWVAGLMIAILVLGMVWTVVIGVQSHRTISILREEPKGILGIAALFPPSSPVRVQNQERYTISVGFCTWLISQFWEHGGYGHGRSFEDVVDANGVEDMVFVTNKEDNGRVVIMEQKVGERVYKEK